MWYSQTLFTLGKYPVLIFVFHLYIQYSTNAVLIRAFFFCNVLESFKFLAVSKKSLLHRESLLSVVRWHKTKGRIMKLLCWLIDLA